MHLDDIEITSFYSEEPQRRSTVPTRYGRVQRPRSRPKTYARGMLIKIGFCAAVLAAAVLIQKFILEKDGRAVVEASVEDAEQEQREAEDVLGRLRFVDAGGTRSVFAVSQRWSMPVDGAHTTLSDDDTLLSITAKAGDTVSVAAAGEVRAIARDETLGDYIRIHHGSDLESVYYNIQDIRVEVGQPLKAMDTLGKVGDTGVLYVTVSQSGAPQLPAAYLQVTD